MPYCGSSPVVNLAIRTRTSLSAWRPPCLWPCPETVPDGVLDASSRSRPGERARDAHAGAGGRVGRRRTWRRRRRGSSTRSQDFLFTYYSHRPAAAAALAPRARRRAADAAPRTRRGARRGTSVRGDRSPSTAAYVARAARPADHAAPRCWPRPAARPPQLGCFGLHEWAMVYRLAAGRGPARRLAAAAGPRGHRRGRRVPPDRLLALRRLPVLHRRRPAAEHAAAGRGRPAELEQPGCLHAGMDLYKHAFRLAPLICSELVADCFELARDIRVLDMRAAPYDLGDLGLRAGRDRDAGGQAGVRRGPARVHRARRAAAGPADRGVRATAGRRAGRVSPPPGTPRRRGTPCCRCRCPRWSPGSSSGPPSTTPTTSPTTRPSRTRTSPCSARSCPPWTRRRPPGWPGSSPRSGPSTSPSPASARSETASSTCCRSPTTASPRSRPRWSQRSRSARRTAVSSGTPRPHLTLDALSADVTESSTRTALGAAVPAYCRAERVDLAWYEAGRCRVLRSWPLGAAGCGPGASELVAEVLDRGREQLGDPRLATGRRTARGSRRASAGRTPWPAAAPGCRAARGGPRPGPRSSSSRS